MAVVKKEMGSTMSHEKSQYLMQHGFKFLNCCNTEYRFNISNHSHERGKDACRVEISCKRLGDVLRT